MSCFFLSVIFVLAFSLMEMPVIHFLFSAAIEQLSLHGICKPPEMEGLTDEQVEELKLKDEWSSKCYPSGGAVLNPDPIGKRTGNGKKAAVLAST